MKCFLAGVFMLFLYANIYGQRAENAFLEDNLEKALSWMLEKGLPQYYKGILHEEIKKSLYDETGTILYARPHANRPFHSLLFKLWDVGKSRETNQTSSGYYTAVCYLIDIQDDVVEYWVITRSDREKVYDSCVFMITIADTIESFRKVVIRSEVFIPSANIAGREIRFPINDLNVLYSLDARRWPESFKGTGLDEYQVVYRRNGEPYLRKIGRLERKLFNWKYGIKCIK
jgi:hypothetical protein